MFLLRARAIAEPPGALITEVSDLKDVPVRAILREVSQSSDTLTQDVIAAALDANYAYGTYLALLYYLLLKNKRLGEEAGHLMYVLKWRAPFAIKISLLNDMITGKAPVSARDWKAHATVVATTALTLLLAAYWF